jgi:hypothetical protein
MNRPDPLLCGFQASSARKAPFLAYPTKLCLGNPPLEGEHRETDPGSCIDAYVTFCGRFGRRIGATARRDSNRPNEGSDRPDARRIGATACDNDRPNEVSHCPSARRLGPSAPRECKRLRGKSQADAD